MKKLMYIFLALPILTGCKEKKSAGAMGGMPTPEISVTKPIVEDITLTKDYPGYLTTEKTVNLVARVNGTLQSTSYVPGGRVKQGQLLFVIEPTLYKDKVEQAEAELKTAQAQLEYARNNYSRMKEAVKSDAVSQIQVLQAESSVAEGVAAVSNAEAALSTARTNLGYCYVRAPFDGTISKATVDVGSYVGGSLQPVTLATIYKDNQMYAYFNVADNQWLTMAMDNQQLPANLPQKIMVQLGKEGTETYPAALDYLSPNVDLNTGTLTVRANFDNPKGILKSDSGLISLFQKRGIRPQILFQSANVGVLYKMVLQGNGAAILPRSLFSPLDPVSPFSLRPKFIIYSVLAYKKGKILTPAQELVRTLICEQFEISD